MEDESGRMFRVARVLTGSDPLVADTLCARCVPLLRVTGVGISLMTTGPPRGVVCASSPIARAVEELQYVLGEGPCVAAARSGEPVLVPDLGDPGNAWPTFCEGAVALGVQAEFSFPLRVGPVSIGVLDLHQGLPGPLSDQQIADALAAAAVTTRLVLAAQAQAASGQLAQPLEGMVRERVPFHQASGVVAAQLDIAADDAAAVLRAHAFAHDLALNDVANEVILQRLRFDE